MRAELASASAHERSTGQDLLKWLALFFMVVDHLRYVSPALDWAVYPGRLAMPFFCLSIAFNVRRMAQSAISLRSCRRYIGWMALFALISQPFFFFGVGGSPWHLNIFFVLLPALMLAIGLQAGPGRGGVYLAGAAALVLVTHHLVGWHPVVYLLPSLMLAWLKASGRGLRILLGILVSSAAVLANVGAVFEAPPGAMDDASMQLRAAGIAVIAFVAPWAGLALASRAWPVVPPVGMWAYGFYPAHFLVVGCLALLAGR